jgi:hypothetical protein
MLIIALIPVIICVFIALQKKMSFLGGVQLSCVGTALSVLVVLVSIYLATGLDIVSASQESIRLALQQDPEYSKQLYLAVQNILGSPADSQITSGAAIDALYAYLEPGASYSIITALAAYIPLGGLVFYLIPRAIAKKAGAKVAYVPPFSKFRLPPKFGRWSVALLLVALVGQMAGLRNFDYVFVIAFAFFGSIYYVLGMAFMEWWLKRHIKSAAGRAAIIILIALLFIQLNIFIYVGIFEQLIKIRRRVEENRSNS